MRNNLRAALSWIVILMLLFGCSGMPVLAQESIIVSASKDLGSVNIGETASKPLEGDVELNIGYEKKLYAILDPKPDTGEIYTLEWKSLDPTKVGVTQDGNNAVIKAISATGEESVTVALTLFDAEGNDISKADCSVIVPYPEEPDDIELFILPENEDIKLKVNDKKELEYKAKIEENERDISSFIKEIAWTVEQEKDIVKVDKKTGQLEALAVGEATVKLMIKTEQGNEWSAEKQIVVVKNDDSVKIVSVKLEPTSLSMKVGGEAETLKATVETDPADADDKYKQVNWKSSNPGVATVENGKITAIGSGTTIITATSTHDNEKSAICTVTVEGGTPVPPVDPTDMSFKYGASNTVYIGHTYKPTVTFKPVGASAPLAWESGDKTIATVDANGVLTPIKEGSVTVTATTTAKVTLTYSLKLEVKQSAPVVTGIEFDFSGPSFPMYKNQTDRVYIKVTPAEALKDAKIGLKLNKKKIVKVVGFGIDENGKYFVDIKALKKGTVKLTATCEGIKAVLKIKVSKHIC